MKTFVPYIIANLALATSAIWVGCVPSGYQSPRTLRPGQASVGAGVALPFTYGDLSLCLRCGVIKNLDVGIKMGGSNDGYGVFSDIKYCFLKHPLLVAADLGFIYHEGEFMNEYEPRTQGVHPTILLGSDRFYGGIGWNYSVKRETHYSMGPSYSVWDIVTRSSGPRIMLGTSWGRRWKFNPEIIFNFDPLLRHDAGVMIGCGIHRFFGKQAKD